MTEDEFKKLEKMYKDIEQINIELNCLKQCNCYIRLEGDNGYFATSRELHSISSSAIYNFAFEYLTKKLANLQNNLKTY